MEGEGGREKEREREGRQSRCNRSFRPSGDLSSTLSDSDPIGSSLRTHMRCTANIYGDNPKLRTGNCKLKRRSSTCRTLCGSASPCLGLLPAELVTEID